jgi:hypothetical protein
MFIVSFLLSSFVHCGGFLAEAGQARDVAGDDGDQDDVHRDLLGGAVRQVSQVVVAMARLPSDGVSGRHMNDAIARLRDGQ